MYYRFNPAFAYLQYVMHHSPGAVAEIKGSEKFPDINGLVSFYPLKNEMLITADIRGLPNSNEPCGNAVFGFHIHSGGKCSGSKEDPFADTLGHYNKDNCMHPMHNGDLPPLFSNNGAAWMAFLTNLFALADIIGKTVVIHRDPDDFHTQPSGNSGIKIACGEIRKVK